MEDEEVWKEEEKRWNDKVRSYKDTSEVFTEGLWPQKHPSKLY